MNNTKFLVLASLAVFAIVGCENTAQGIQRDSAEIGHRAADVAVKTSEDLKAGVENVTAAVTLTHRIKVAILANPNLNDIGNLIDVDSTRDKVILSGHVKSQSAKDEAESIARKVLADENATQSLVNNLTIQR